MNLPGPSQEGRKERKGRALRVRQSRHALLTHRSARVEMANSASPRLGPLCRCCSRPQRPCGSARSRCGPSRRVCCQAHPSVRLSAVYTEPGSCAHRAETGAFSGRRKRIHGSVFRRGRMVEVLSRHDAWLHCPVRCLRKRGERATIEAARKKTQLAARNADAVGGCCVLVFPGRRFRWEKQLVQTGKIRVHMV